MENIQSEFFENNVSNCEEAPLNNENNFNDDIIYLDSGYYSDGWDKLYYDADRDCFYGNNKIIKMTPIQKQYLKKDIMNQFIDQYMDKRNKNTNPFDNKLILNKNKYLANKNIKFTSNKFVKYIQDLYVQVALKMINLNNSNDINKKININKNSFKEILNCIQQKIEEIKKYFEENFKNKLEELSEKAENLHNLISKIDFQMGNENYYLSGAYDHYRLKKIAKENINELWKPEIQSKVYENICEIICYKFSED